MTSVLIETGPCDTNVVLLTGQTKTSTLARYHNLQGLDGLLQETNIFWSVFESLQTRFKPAAVSTKTF